MRRAQWILILSGVLLFVLLWVGFDRVPPEIKRAEKSRSLSFEKISIDKIISDVTGKLPPDQRESVMTLNRLAAKSDSLDISRNYQERLASFWFGEGHPEISAHYAERIAIKSESAEDWSITGTTYILCSKEVNDAEIGDYCRNKAVSAFESCITLEPQNVDHKINLALAYVNRPLEKNPMKGIQMLIGLNQENPQDVKVLYQLARLSIQTNQLDNAKKRLYQILKVEPSYLRAHCMLVDVHKAGGNVPEFEKHLQYCNSPSGE